LLSITAAHLLLTFAASFVYYIYIYIYILLSFALSLPPSPLSVCKSTVRRPLSACVLLQIFVLLLLLLYPIILIVVGSKTLMNLEWELMKQKKKKMELLISFWPFCHFCCHILPSLLGRVCSQHQDMVKKAATERARL